MIKSSNSGMFTIPAAPSAGTSVTQSGSANTYGSYVQMIASTAEADYIVGLRFAISAAFGTTPTYLSVAIGTGGAGSETLVGTVDCPFYNANVGSVSGAGTPTIGGRVDLPFPIPVAASTRIACKTASDQAAANGWKITLECHKQADLIDAGLKEQADVQTWLTAAPNALIGGRVDANVGVNSDKTGYSLSVSPPTAATIATSIWQDATASDFTAAGSIGKSLYTGNHAPGTASGLPINNSAGNAPVDVQTWLAVAVQSDDTFGNPIVTVDAINNIFNASRTATSGTSGTVSFPANGTRITQVGDQMDLVNAPNATAITSIQSGLATSSALSGVATNAATAATQSTLAATQTTAASIAAAVWNALTASYQAVGSFGKWVLGLVAPAVNVTITPVQANITTGTITSTALEAILNATMPPLVFNPVDQLGNPITMVGPVKFRLFQIGTNTPGNELIVDTITATLSNANKTATIQVPKTDNNAVTVYGWTMWDTGNNDQPLAEGTYQISDAGPAP